MTSDNFELTRRKLIAAGVGITGLGFSSGLAMTARSDPISHSRTLRVEQSEIDLVIGWSEFYNGTELEQSSPVDIESNGPVVTLSNVQPGDEGRLHFGLEIDEETSTADSAQLQMQMPALESSFNENGITEPESRAGDTTTETGELQKHVDVTVWYDVGYAVANNDITGQCDAVENAGEPTIVEGSLATVTDVLDDWVSLDATPGQQGQNCLSTNETLCIGVKWSLSEDIADVNDNVVQTDSSAFQIGFRAASCSEQ